MELLLNKQINFSLIKEQLGDAGLPTKFDLALSKADGIVSGTFAIEVPPEDEAAVVALIDAHDASNLSTKEVLAAEIVAIRGNVDTQIGSIPDYFTWDVNEGDAWIDANVTDLASAKLVLKKLWAMNCAIRDYLMADRVASLRG